MSASFSHRGESNSAREGVEAKKQIDLYSPEIQFDESAANEIIAAQRALSERWLVHGGHDLPPHISIGGAKKIDTGAIESEMPSFLKETHAFQLNFSSLGLFKGGVLFTAPAVSDELITFHESFHSIFERHAVSAVEPYYEPANLVPHTTIGTGIVDQYLQRAILSTLEHLSLPLQATVANFSLFGLPSIDSLFTQELPRNNMLKPSTASMLVRPTREMYFLQLLFDAEFNERIDLKVQEFAQQTANRELIDSGHKAHLTLAGTSQVNIPDMCEGLENLAVAIGAQDLTFASVGMFPKPGSVFLRAVANGGFAHTHSLVQDYFQSHSESAPYLYYTKGQFVPHVAVLAGSNSYDSVATIAARSVQEFPLPMTTRASHIALVRTENGKGEIIAKAALQ